MTHKPTPCDAECCESGCALPHDCIAKDPPAVKREDRVSIPIAALRLSATVIMAACDAMERRPGDIIRQAESIAIIRSICHELRQMPWEI